MPQENATPNLSVVPDDRDKASHLTVEGREKLFPVFGEIRTIKTLSMRLDELEPEQADDLWRAADRIELALNSLNIH